MITVTKAPDTLYSVTILLNGMVRSYPLYLSEKILVIPVCDIDEQLRKDSGYKDVRIMGVMKIKEIIEVNL